MIVRLLSVSISAMAVSASALAQGNKPAPTRKPVSAFEACLNKAGANDQAASICENQETARKDQRVAALYKQLLAKSEEPARSVLVKSQRDYLAYRDSHCNYIFQEWGGTEARTQASACRAKMTDERLEHLSEFWEIVRDREPIRPYVPR